MNYLDLEKAVDWIETRWGTSKAWARWEELYDDFANYTAGALRQALHQFYKAGHRYPPSPAELMKATAEVQALRIARGDDQIPRDCSGDHVWADPLPFEEDRHRICVLCGQTGRIVSCDHQFSSRGRCVWCPAQEKAA